MALVVRSVTVSRKKNWARLIQKIYPPRRINPLVCSKCFGSMKIISFIEDEQLVKKILKHLHLWEVKRKPTFKKIRLRTNW